MTDRKPCPACGTEMLRGLLDGVDSWACTACYYSKPVLGGADLHTEPRTVYKLPHVDPGPPHKRIRKSEAETERDFDAHARARGWEVLSTVRRRKGVICPKCKWFFWQKGGDGCSKGVPDRLLRRPDMPPYLWYGVELKGSHTPVSDEQQDLADRDCIIVARNWADFEAALNTTKEDVLHD